MVANTNETRVAYVVEDTENTIPEEPDFQTLRYTGETLNIERDVITSQEIETSRNVTDLLLVSGQGSGGVSFELSDGTFEDLIEGLMQSAWSSDAIVNGITKKSFTFEATYKTGGTDLYKRISGCQINTMSLSFTPGEAVTGSLDILGRTGISDNAIVTGATYEAPNSEPIMTAADDFAGLSIGGLTNPRVTAVTLNVTNNLRAQRVVGSIDPAGIGSGRFEVTGEISLFLDVNQKAAIDAFLANTASSLSFTVGRTTLKKTRFNMPNIKFGGGIPTSPALDQDVVVAIPFTALKDTGIGGTLQITRNVT